MLILKDFGRYLEFLTDSMAFALNPSFPQSMHGDTFIVDGQARSIAANRQPNGKFKVATYAGQGIFSALDEVKADTVDLGGALILMQHWENKQRKINGCREDLTAVFGNGAHYRNVAQWMASPCPVLT